MFTIYPAIDLRNGQVVRLRKGDPNQQTTYSSDPVAISQKWQEAGAEWLHVVNLDGAFGDDAASRDLPPNVFLCADCPLHEAENLIPVGIGNEQFLEDRQVRNREIALPVTFLPHEGVKQPIVNDQAGRICQTMRACSTQVFPVPVAIFRQYFG
jgi:hypothetical protein